METQLVTYLFNTGVLAMAITMVAVFRAMNEIILLSDPFQPLEEALMRDRTSSHKETNESPRNVPSAANLLFLGAPVRVLLALASITVACAGCGVTDSSSSTDGGSGDSSTDGDSGDSSTDGDSGDSSTDGDSGDSSTATGPTLSVSTTEAATGETVTVYVSGGNSGFQEWVALFDASAADSSLSVDGNWQYLNGTQTEPSVGLASAVLAFVMPDTPGTYNFRYFAENGVGNRLAVSETVTVGTTHVACDYYASPNGSGNGLAPDTPFHIADFWNVAQPGHVLCLLDGVYTGDESMINPPEGLSGTESQRITVRALNDGAVRINGQSERRPVWLRNNSYFVVEGFDAHDSDFCVVMFWEGSHHSIARRIVAWDARDRNAHVFSVHSSNNALLEDVAGFGVGRKIMAFAQGSNDCTCRRCWLRWEGSTNVGPKMAMTMWYNTQGSIAENVIATWDNGSMPAVYTLQNQGTVWTDPPLAGTYTNGVPTQGYGLFSRDNQGSSGYSAARARIYGSIGYVRGGTRFDATSLFYLNGQDDVQVVNSVAYAEPGAYDNKIPFHLYPRNDLSPSVDLAATSLSSIGVRANTITSEWGQTNIHHASSTSDLPDSVYLGQGARLCYEYVNGQETSVPLWPWRMNGRIYDATALAADAGHQHKIYQGNPPVLTTVNDPHAGPVDVTATVEAMFGPIPSECCR